MKRFLCAMICMVFLMTSFAMADSEYTVAEKMLKQIEAGSGFSAELSLDVTDAEGQSRLQKPIQMNVNYIETESGKDCRTELSLVDGERTLSAVNLRIENGKISFQADVLSPDWYSLSMNEKMFSMDGILSLLFSVGGETAAGTDEAEAEPETTDEPTETEAEVETTEKPDEAETESETTEEPDEAETKPEKAAPAIPEGGLMELTGVPQLSDTLLTLYMRYRDQDMETLYNEMTTRLDLWLEGFRTEAVLEKDQKSNSFLTVSYLVPATAIKAEMKTLILELMENEELVSMLAAPLSKEEQALYLNPAYQSYYFAAVDALRLSGQMKIERKMSTTTGVTQNLQITFPMMDSKTGNAELSYERSLDDEGKNTHILTLAGSDRTLKVTLIRDIAKDNTFMYNGKLILKGENDSQQLDFLLTLKDKTGKTVDGEKQVVETTLELTPSNFLLLGSQPLKMSADISFTSANAKTAATYIEGTAKLEEGNSVYQLSFSGKTRKKWDVANITEVPTDILSLPFTESIALLTAGFGNTTELLKPYLTK